MRTNRPGIVLAAAMILPLWSCGWGADGTARLSDTYPSPPADDVQCSNPAQDAVLGEGRGEGMNGQWAMRVAQHGTFEPAGELWDITVTDLAMVSFVEFPPGDRGMVLTFCDQPNEVDTKGNEILKP
ncbi:MAG: hypothetical protein GXP54_07675, partial [Deltaproteobacteria bacterium]|nr:hypothetical protein [Deltaproteobacteria bacterium]